MKPQHSGKSRILQPGYINRGVRHWHETPTAFHSHAEIKIVVAVRGTFILKTRSGEREVRASSVVIVPSFLSHRFMGREGTVEMLVMTFPNLNARWRAMLLPTKRLRLIALDARDMMVIDELHRRCAEEKVRGDAFAHLALAGLAQALLAVLTRAAPRPRGPPRRDAQLQKAQQQIVAHFHEPLRIHDLAREVGMSEALFRGQYRQWLGHSPKEEIMQLRVRKAQALLLETNNKLADIAARCGFCNEQEFSRHFRNHVGMTPGCWRKQE